MIRRIAALAAPLVAGSLVAGSLAAGLAMTLPAGPAGATAGAAGTAAGSAGAARTVAGPAAASLPTQDSPYSIGYGATNEQFRAAAMTTTLGQDAGKFPSSYQPFISLYNSSVSPEVELIPTGNSSAPTDSWNPNADDGPASATGINWIQAAPYPRSSACYGNTDIRGCFYAGETVTLAVYYNDMLHEAFMTITDRANGNAYSAHLTFGRAETLTSVHVGEVWRQNFDALGFTPTREPKQLGTITSVSLTDAAGHQRPLGRWPCYKRVMTSTGTAQGTAEGEPGDLTDGGRVFSVTVR
jgi:hypothetical protein